MRLSLLIKKGPTTNASYDGNVGQDTRDLLDDEERGLKKSLSLFFFFKFDYLLHVMC